eukprot:TRINITY_DN65776_c0_g1_i1.p1 TRINITY_DN65776_c0_g1~~TRINITY_DN65776_c0_g1_i1.p1  ORF type:complete len:550 (+),score=152.96 TRINITY_DN65776_c0_g1_i1:85-1650(+)
MPQAQAAVSTADYGQASAMLPAVPPSGYGATGAPICRRRRVESGMQVAFSPGTRMGSLAGMDRRPSLVSHDGVSPPPMGQLPTPIPARRWTTPDNRRQGSVLLGEKYARRSTTRMSMVSTILDEYDRTPLLPRTMSQLRHAQSWLSGLDEEPEQEMVELGGSTPVQEAIGYAMLLFGVCSMSSVGSVVQQFNGVHGALLGSWVAQGLHFCFFFASIVWLAASAEARKSFYVRPRMFLLLAVTGIASGVGSAGFTTSLTFTSQTDAYLFNSFPPTFIMIVRTLSGCPTFCGEKVAVLINLVGAYLNVKGTVAHSVSSGSHPLLGDALALFSSATDALTILTSKFLCTSLPTPVILCVITFFSAITQAGAALLIYPETTLSASPDGGVFGWATSDWVGWWALLVGAFFIGQMCMLGSLNMLPSLVMSMGQTMQPVGATIVAVCITKQEPLPSPMSLVGGSLIVLGCMLLAYASRNHQLDESDDAEEVEVAISGLSVASDGPAKRLVPGAVLPEAVRNAQLGAQ